MFSVKTQFRMWVGFWLTKENMIGSYAKAPLFFAKASATCIMNYSPDHLIVAFSNKHTTPLTSIHKLLIVQQERVEPHEHCPSL